MSPIYRTMYISLWDGYGNEASFPGYCRMAVTMCIDAGKAISQSNALWKITGDGNVDVVKLKIHDAIRGEPVLECSLTRNITQPMRAGDNLNISAGGVSADLSGTVHSEFLRSAVLAIETFDEFIEKYPDATPREIWEAAFVSGHRTAHTLLTGEST